MDLVWWKLEMESKHLLNQNKQTLIRNQLPELCSKLQFCFTQISFNFVSTSIDRHRPGAEFNFRLNLLRSVIPKQEFNYTSKGLLINSYLTKIDSLDSRDFSNSFSDLISTEATMNSGEMVWIVLSKGRVGSYRAVSTSPSGQLKTEKPTFVVTRRTNDHMNGEAKTFIACTELFYFSVRFSPFRFSFHRHFPHDYIFGSAARKGIKQIDIFFSSFRQSFSIVRKIATTVNSTARLMQNRNETKTFELC